MSETILSLFNTVFKLMAENKLKNDIDDTLLEKMLTFIQKPKLQLSNVSQELIKNDFDSDQVLSSELIKTLIKRTEILNLIEKVLSSVIQRNKNYFTAIKSFVIRLLGLIYEVSEELFPCEKLLPLLKNEDDTVVADHIPSVQDALLFCLSSITKHLDGCVWFLNQNLQDFVFSSFSSKSYYVRKSAVNFFIKFITQWIPHTIVETEQKEPKISTINSFMKQLISFIIDHIHLYRNSEEIVFSECCIVIMKALIEEENISFLKDSSNLVKNISDCFIDLTEDKEFNRKLMDLFLSIHFRFALPDEIIHDVFKCLIMKQDIKLAIDLASLFASSAWSKPTSTDEINFFLLPIYILLNSSVKDCHNYFSVNSADIYDIMLKKMEDKSECKSLFISSLLAFKSVAPLVTPGHQRYIASEILNVTKCSQYPHHKWLFPVLEDRLVHHSLIEFYSSLLSEDVYQSLICENNDLVFQNIVEFLKKPISDCNFLSQLLLLLKDVLILHKKHAFTLNEKKKNELIQLVCRNLMDNRESVVDSAIHVAGQIMNMDGWQDQLCQQKVHTIIWDMAFHGSIDGSIRSTALRVIVDSCQDAWCLNEMKSLKNTAEFEIAKMLFDLTYDPDFFLQREALLCLFQWMKSKWNDFPDICKEYLHCALVSATESLDLELKLTSLDVWMWLLENKYTFSVISPSLDVKDYVRFLASNGFGLSMILALEDYDQAVQYKAANILSKVRQTLTSCGNSFDSLKLDSTTVEEPEKNTNNLFQPISKEERDKGIDCVLELTTTEQIANICHPIQDSYHYEQNNFLKNTKSRTCTIFSFWKCIWSDSVIKILQPSNAADVMDGESILKDIISARITANDLIEDTPDCY